MLDGNEHTYSRELPHQMSLPSLLRARNEGTAVLSRDGSSSSLQQQHAIRTSTHNNIDSASNRADDPNKSNRAWSFDASNARKVQSALYHSTGRKSLPLQAYAEPSLDPPNLNPTPSAPRLSVRTHSPDALTRYDYHAVKSCSDVPKLMPTGHPPSQDAIYGTNTFNRQPLHPKRHEYARWHCPVDADPFLPWVHDVFPSMDGKFVEFVAHNKRRCNTDPKFFFDDITNLEPQVAIMQPVPIKRLDGGDDEAQRMQPAMWKWNATGDTQPLRYGSSEGMAHATHRYRLASHEEADVDAIETRFICRFHTLAAVIANSSDRGSTSPLLEPVILGETLSVTPYNYELLNLRKPGSQPMLTRPESKYSKGGSGTAPHNSAVWNAMHHFRCPVPDHLVDLVRSGDSVVDNVPSIYVDVVPIRTHARDTREGYIRRHPRDTREAEKFDPNLEWGSNHVLPVVEASGRWANFPICRSPASTGTKVVDVPFLRPLAATSQPEKHYLTGCTWASAAYTTRGDGNFDTSTSERLFEWLIYNFNIAGFDHIYVYDNTGAHTNETSLAAVTDLFPGRVTRIEWPHRICNNNRPAHSNTGERSSQHAAEASCRIRYGPTTQWLANIDSDEYLVPVGKWKSIFEWLHQSVDKEKSTHILSFFQTRAKPIAELMEPYADDHSCKTCLKKNSSRTYLETYNCEPTKLPKPSDWAWRAKKQIYRPWYVLNHFVHYSMATIRINEHPGDTSPRFKERPPYERRVDEVNEAFMLHTKSTLPKHTAGWYDKCKSSADNCPVGVPWPRDDADTNQPSKLLYGLQNNCYRHEGVVNDVLPRLHAALVNHVRRGKEL